jgi:hypothetical protein
VGAFLETPSVPLVVDAAAFDAFAWCESDVLEWRAPGGSRLDGRVTQDNPPRMVFVMRMPLPFLPRELARLHVPGLGLEEEWALAPYGIDDATDGLWEHRVAPKDAFWLAADSLAGLFWGLHDWAHFHNHGPFTDRPATELQCDAAALAWLWLNRGVLGLDGETWERTRADVERIAEARFVEEGRAMDARALDASSLRSKVACTGVRRVPFSDPQ